ncbi:hypothetical protein CTAYLR_003610 [Chrysophaeum taylorii]|uniref:Fe2OG dioxygenase domain-containing protein n=1 Tax=Chrysophaeum taylorii TaxID=2483200 RepID=A0AAD7UEN5_9STRA|nr:hypothetical protein CTAYLR_003610 [Chrysophaeum taylorii]
MRFEWLGGALWLGVAAPVSVRSVVRAWGRIRHPAKKRDEDAVVDAALTTLGWMLLHLCVPMMIMWLSPDNAVVDVRRVRNVLSEAEASEIVRLCEAHAAATGGWLTARHAWYPTTDVAVESVSGLDLREVVHNRVFPILVRSYGVRTENLSLRDLFVVKYDGRGQRGLVKHRDGCELSFGVALTATHRSTAGTYFPSFRHALAGVRVGEAWTHPSLALHSARPVMDDDETRYVLVGFVLVRPTWKHFWRTWGSWATRLREWHLDELVFESPAVSTPKLALRRARDVLHDLLAPDAPPAGKLLVYVGALLCLLLGVLALALLWDCVAHFCLPDFRRRRERRERPSSRFSSSLLQAEARGRYYEEEEEEEDLVLREGPRLMRASETAKSRGHTHRD